MLLDGPYHIASLISHCSMADDISSLSTPEWMAFCRCSSAAANGQPLSYAGLASTGRMNEPRSTIEHTTTIWLSHFACQVWINCIYRHANMRVVTRLLAAVKPARYLEAGNPTGLTGLFNHPAPRSALLFLYGSTLDKLKAFPEHSVYRQSIEALTKHRMNIIESIKPEGYEEWAKRAAETVQRNPEAFQPGGRHQYVTAGGEAYVSTEERGGEDQEWTSSEGTRTREEKAAESRLIAKGRRKDYSATVTWEPEPALEISQSVTRSETSYVLHPDGS